MSWDNVGPNQCHMDGTPIVRDSPKDKKKMAKYDHGGGCGCGLYRECIPGCEYAPIKIKKICDCGPNGYCSCGNKLEKNRKNKVDNDTDDFGFTMVTEGDLQTPADTRAEQLRDLIMPLLNNLKSNPDKDIIRWNGPDRVKKIDEFIKKMNNLISG